MSLMYKSDGRSTIKVEDLNQVKDVCQVLGLFWGLLKHDHFIVTPHNAKIFFAISLNEDHFYCVGIYGGLYETRAIILYVRPSFKEILTLIEIKIILQHTNDVNCKYGYDIRQSGKTASLKYSSKPKKYII